MAGEGSIAKSTTSEEPRIDEATPGVDVAMTEAGEEKPLEAAEQEVTTETIPMTDASLIQANEGGPSGSVASPVAEPEVEGM